MGPSWKMLALLRGDPDTFLPHLAGASESKRMPVNVTATFNTALTAEQAAKCKNSIPEKLSTKNGEENFRAHAGWNTDKTAITWCNEVDDASINTKGDGEGTHFKKFKALMKDWANANGKQVTISGDWDA